jgi:NADH-quinone oxidoreductase subunit D
MMMNNGIAADTKILPGENGRKEMVINMGPQHPSTHGVLRLELVLDGEVITECRPNIGYLHQMF